MRRILPLAVIVLAIWGLVALGISWTRSIRPTPEKIDAYLSEAGDLQQLNSNERHRLILRVADDLDRLGIEQRQHLRRPHSPFNSFFASLNDAERSDFLDRTLPQDFKQMMLAFNEMKPEKRKKIIERTLKDLDRAETNGLDPAERALDEKQTQKIINQGLEAFYNDANADVKLELAPVIERLQKVMQNVR